ncbi:hypothetical protein [Tautonia marina]|uniref:hypothetical protein n=1 Tax=Tautonia marina TaxID=2653855 RepID=UPI0012604717|nr:hypothetical protein [Tautonia marina]
MKIILAFVLACAAIAARSEAQVDVRYDPATDRKVATFEMSRPPEQDGGSNDRPEAFRLLLYGDGREPADLNSATFEMEFSNLSGFLFEPRERVMFYADGERWDVPVEVVRKARRPDVIYSGPASPSNADVVVFDERIEATFDAERLDLMAEAKEVVIGIGERRYVVSGRNRGTLATAADIRQDLAMLDQIVERLRAERLAAEAYQDAIEEARAEAKSKTTRRAAESFLTRRHREIVAELCERYDLTPEAIEAAWKARYSKP